MQTQFGNWSIALGIDWTMPSDAGEVRAQKKKRAEQKEHAKDSFVLMTSSTGQRWLGFHAPVSGSVYAAALLVAMVKPNAVVYFPFNEYKDGEYVRYSDAWVCAIQDGMPVVGYDRVLPAAEARNTAIEWSSMFPQAEMIGDLQGAQASLADVLTVLDEGLQSKTVQRKQIAFALLSTSGFPLVRIAVGAGVVIVAGALAYGATWYMDVRQAQQDNKLTLEDAARRSMASAEEKARQEAERKAALATFHAQVDAARVAQQSRLSPASFWSGVSALRSAVGISQRGYRPQLFDCTPQSCRVTWLGAGRFVRVADKMLLPNVERNLGADLTAASVFPLAARQDAMPASRAGSGEELRLLLQSAFSAHAKNATVDAPQPLTISAPPAAGPGVQPVVVAEVGKWRAQLQGSAATLDAGTVLEMMARWPIRVTAVRYQPVANYVDLEGEFVFMPEQKG